MSHAHVESLPTKLLAWCGLAAGPTRRPSPELTVPAGLGGASLAPLRDWREAAGGLDGPVVPASAFRRVSRLLGALGPEALARGRLALLLDVVGPGRPLEQLPELLPGIAEWRLLVARNLNEAEELGLVTVARRRARLSLAGRERLAALAGEGFSREGWLFVERCLRERPEAICSACASANRIHWYWDSFDCRRCGRRNAAASAAVLPPRRRCVPMPG
jgi:hypothetical protein